MGAAYNAPRKELPSALFRARRVLHSFVVLTLIIATIKELPKLQAYYVQTLSLGCRAGFKGSGFKV